MDETKDQYQYHVLCEHKDPNPTNLNKLFETYGTNTLEHLVPVVSDPVVDKLQKSDKNERVLRHLGLKAEAAAMAREGCRPMTRNRALRMVRVGSEVVLAAGEVRERSPVNRRELDDQLEEYMAERARLRFAPGGSGTMTADTAMSVASQGSNESATQASVMSISEPVVVQVKEETQKEKGKKKKKKNKDEEIPTQDDLDDDLEAYMREGQRVREQKKMVAESTDRMETMRVMDELTTNFDLDAEDDDGDALDW